jgi:exportin-5
VDQIKLRHSKVCHSVLDTFTAFVEWAPMQHIMANNHYLVRCLCHLLRDDRLQIYAAECLLAIVSWKIGKLTDRVHLLVLFQSDMISPLFEAVEAANLKTMQGEDDAHYLFLKRTVQILVELGLQVVALWSAKETNCQRPENFEIYLNALLAFTYHNSQMVNYLANELWAKFFRHPDIFKDSETFQSFVPKWVEAAMKKSVRSGHPSKEDHPSCVYSRMDFETDEEFSSFFGRYR